MGNCYATQDDSILENMNTRQVHLYTRILALKLTHLNFEPLKLFAQLYSQASTVKPARQYVEQVMLEFKRFFFLGAVCDSPDGQRQFRLTPDELVPSPIVDRMWRLILSNTQVYAKACTGLFKDSFFHRDGNKFYQLDNYGKTLSMYDSYFGRPKSNLWPRFKDTESFKNAQNGFLFFQAEQFKRFHHNFVKNVTYQNQKSVHHHYSTQIKSLQKEEVYHMHRFQNEWLRIKARKNSGRHKVRHFSSNVVVNLTLTLDDISERGDEDADDASIEEMKFRKELINISVVLYEPIRLQKREKELKVCPSKIKLDHLDIVDDSIDSIDLTDYEDNSVVKKSTFASSTVFQRVLQQEPKTMLKDNWSQTKFNLISKLSLYTIPKHVVNNLRKETNSTTQLAEAQFIELKRFLLLSSISKVRLMPSMHVKEAWDYFLAETQAYRSFCQSVFREFKHSCQEVSGNPTRYQATKILYRDVFHEEPNPYFWPETSHQRLRMFPRYKFINVMGSVAELLMDSQLIMAQNLQKPRIKTDLAHMKKAVEGMKF